jgi:hypothetical protein
VKSFIEVGMPFQIIGACRIAVCCLTLVAQERLNKLDEVQDLCDCVHCLEC